MSDDWYCKTQSQEFGPMASQALRKLATKGALKRDDLVKRGQNGQWNPASKVKGLFRDIEGVSADWPDNSVSDTVADETITAETLYKRRRKKKNTTENKDAAKQNDEYAVADRITRVADRITRVAARIFKLIGAVVPIVLVVLFVALARYQPIDRFWKNSVEYYGQDDSYLQNFELIDEIVFYTLSGAVPLIWLVLAGRRRRKSLSEQYPETKAREEAKKLLERHQKQRDYPEKSTDDATRHQVKGLFPDQQSDARQPLATVDLAEPSRGVATDIATPARLVTACLIWMFYAFFQMAGFLWLATFTLGVVLSDKLDALFNTSFDRDLFRGGLLMGLLIVFFLVTWLVTVFLTDPLRALRAKLPTIVPTSIVSLVLGLIGIVSICGFMFAGPNLRQMNGLAVFFLVPSGLIVAGILGISAREQYQNWRNEIDERDLECRFEKWVKTNPLGLVVRILTRERSRKKTFV